MTFVIMVGTEWRKYPAELVGLYLKYIHTLIVFILFYKFFHTFSKRLLQRHRVQEMGKLVVWN